ncbi:MAG: hydrogenase nickel incorporation protein HypB [Candidatus Lokiarchaeota archaeon]|nr:hydrogenase nickel incorporation protein HypB [Candidatus Lokiarchaeota archaeon]
MKEREFERVVELESRKLAREDNRQIVIETQKEVEKNNNTIANLINNKLHEHNIKSFDIVGAIGAGKTAILEKITDRLAQKFKILVICGDITTRVDADRIQKKNVDTIQINTGRECALNAYYINKVINNIDLCKYNIIFIENVGNLICPAEFLLGMDKRIIVVSTTEGEWVVEKHPLLFKMSEIAIINKIDLVERLETDLDKMVNDAKEINPNIEVILTSTKTDEGIEDLIKKLNLK